jgi:predicted transcriptional regulator
VSEPDPLPDAVEEGQRVVDAADERGLTVRLIGGTAINRHAQAAREEPFKRGYRDVDFVGTRQEEDELVELMTDLGYEENERFNTMRRFRLEFVDPVNERKADYILDRFEFCHEWDLSDRLELDHPTIPIEDLLLSKLQIVEVSDRDVRDILAMLTDHPVSEADDTEAIDPSYISGLCSGDWGLYKTVTMSLERVDDYVSNNEFPVVEATIESRIEALDTAIEEQPKSFRWKLRSLVGERKQWYKRPELG